MGQANPLSWPTYEPVVGARRGGCAVRQRVDEPQSTVKTEVKVDDLECVRRASPQEPRDDGRQRRLPQRPTEARGLAPELDGGAGVQRGVIRERTSQA